MERGFSYPSRLRIDNLSEWLGSGLLLLDAQSSLIHRNRISYIPLTTIYAKKIAMVRMGSNESQLFFMEENYNHHQCFASSRLIALQAFFARIQSFFKKII